MEFCMDKKTSLSLQTKIFIKTKSELDEKPTESEILSTTATSLSENVDDSVFVLPVGYSILDSACDNKELVVIIDPYKDYSNSINLNVIGSLNNYRDNTIRSSIQLPQTILKKYKTEVLSVELLKLQGTTNRYQVCVSDECQNFNCIAGKSVKCAKKSGDKATCEADKECIYLDPLCEKFDCLKITEEEACKSKDLCKWLPPSYQGGDGYCYQKKCYDYKTKNKCESSNLECKWTDNDFGCGCYGKNTIIPANQQKRNISQCNQLSGASKDGCIQQIAVSCNNLKLCEDMLSPQFKYPCYTAIALNNDDINICYEIPLENEYLARENCISDVAQKLNDKSICNKIQTGFVKDYCLKGYKPALLSS